MNNISEEMLAAYFSGNQAGFGTGTYLGDNGNPIQQSYSDTCAIKSQQLILNDFGIPCTEDDLVKYSIEHGWYQGNGTSPNDVGNLLEHAGVHCHKITNANVFNLVSELSQGHKIIVGVDSGELWGDRFQGWMEDYYMGQTPDHALLVTGIDTSDMNNVKVIVTDPGTGEAGKAYPLDQFMDAWSDANCFMCSTNEPAPATTPGMENFDYTEGHLPEIAGIDYSQFQIFNDLSMGLPIMIPTVPGFDPTWAADYMHDFGLVNQPLDYPVASLVDAYFDVAHQQTLFTDIFHDYAFNQYLDTSVVNNFMSQSYLTAMAQLNIDPALSWDTYAMNNGLFGEVSNLDYANYLGQTIDTLQMAGDFANAGILDQQQLMLNYCNGYNLNFYDTFCS